MLKFELFEIYYLHRDFHFTDHTKHLAKVFFFEKCESETLL